LKKQDPKKPVVTLGQHLRKERELRGIDLDEVSKVTRVRIAYLQYLEEDRLIDLPATVYTRGYIRAYAGFLGIDAARCVELCEKQSVEGSLSPAAAFDGTFGVAYGRSAGFSLGGSIAEGPLPVLSEDRSEPAATPTSTGGMAAMGGARATGRSRIGLAVLIVMLFFAAILITGVYYVNRSGDPGQDSKNKPPAAKNVQNPDFFLDS